MLCMVPRLGTVGLGLETRESTQAWRQHLEGYVPMQSIAWHAIVAVLGVHNEGAHRHSTLLADLYVAIKGHGNWGSLSTHMEAWKRL